MSDTATMWRKRVAAWRASGETAAAFSARKGFVANTLRHWSWRLRRETAATPVVRLAQLVRSPEVMEPARSLIVIEMLDARARITVETGVDRATLTTVVAVVDARGAR